VDIWLLVESLEDSELEYLRNVTKAGSSERPVCCYQGDDGDYQIKDKIQGFARIIVYNDQDGIVLF
jgi:hypothetical protein